MSACMCVLGYDGDGPTFSTRRLSAARWPHECYECGRTILQGESYEREFGVWDGTAQTFRTCAECTSIRDTFFCDGFAFGNIYTDLGEHLREIDGNVSSDCILALTPKARDLVFEMIQGIWNDEDLDREDDAAVAP